MDRKPSGAGLSLSDWERLVLAWMRRRGYGKWKGKSRDGGVFTVANEYGSAGRKESINMRKKGTTGETQRYRNVEEKIKRKSDVMEWRTAGGWREMVVGSSGRIKTLCFSPSSLLQLMKRIWCSQHVKRSLERLWSSFEKKIKGNIKKQTHTHTQRVVLVFSPSVVQAKPTRTPDIKHLEEKT